MQPSQPYTPAGYPAMPPAAPTQPQPAPAAAETESATGLSTGRIWLLAGVVAAGALLALVAFVLQYQAAAPTRAASANAAAQLKQLQAGYAQVQNLGTVSTAGWQPFCDQTNGYCFTYPKDWAVDSVADPTRGYVTATVTNPTKTVQATYGAPYYKTSGNATFRPFKVEDITIAGTRLKLVGGYYISSVYYSPFYVLVNEDAAKNLSTAGDTTIWDNDMRFLIGNDTIKFNVGSTKTTLTSRQQAEVWFSSTDGKAAYALIKTLAPASANTAYLKTATGPTKVVASPAGTPATKKAAR